MIRIIKVIKTITLSKQRQKRPTLSNRQNPIVEEDGILYSGCYVNASINFGSWTILTVKSTASLNAIQFVKDGEPFGKIRRC